MSTPFCSTPLSVLLLLLLGANCPAHGLSVMSYNIMDSGFADESGRYDPVGDRVPGNLTNFMVSLSPFVDVLGLIETSAWSEHGNSRHPGYIEIAKAWGYSHVHVRGNCAIMSHNLLEIVDEPSEGDSTIVARVKNTTFIVTSMSSISYENKYKDFEAMAKYVMANYKDEPLILMGDLNSLSPQDKARYNETLLCGNGTYDAATQSGEYVENYCLEHAVGDHEWVETKGIKWCSGVDCLIDQSGQCGDEQADIFGAGVNGNCVILPHNMSEQDQVKACEKACQAASKCEGFTFYTRETPVTEACFRSDCSRKPLQPNSTARCYEKHHTWKLDYSPVESLLNNSDLIDLCYVSGGFFDVDTDNRHSTTSQCGFSNPTLLIHMTGHYSDAYAGSHGHDHATAKIDYILANRKMLQLNRFHHTSVIQTFQADGCSDHYPMEATFLP